MKIKFTDLYKLNNNKKKILKKISSLIKESSFVGGKEVKNFENNFKRYIKTKYCISVGNATDALEIAIKSLELKKNSEIIVPVNTWISTAEAVVNNGYKLVFCDINLDDYSICLKDLQNKITKKTSAIIPVHLFGIPANMIEIKKIIKGKNIKLIEDCAQAHGAKIENKIVGSFGDVACFSFFPGKNLGAYGDAGCILTNDEDLARKCRIFARHGAIRKHDHLIEGINSRMDNLQAAILNVKIKYLEKWTEQRREIAEEYRKGLHGLPVIIPELEKNTNSSYHLFIIQIRERDELKDFLELNGISCGIHYPKIIPLQKAYSNYGYTEKDFPIGFEKQSQILSLPIFPEMTKNEINFVLKKIHEFFRK